MKRTAIVGSRSFDDYDKMYTVILTEQIKHGSSLLLCSGGARGADSMAREIAKELNIPFVEFPVKFYRNGQQIQYGDTVDALYDRNTVVATFCDTMHAFYVTDFPAGGTKHASAKAHDMGKPVYEYHPSGKIHVKGSDVTKITDFTEE